MSCGELSEAAKAKFAELDRFIDTFNIDRNDERRRGWLIRVLHRAQAIFGYLPREVQQHVARRLYLSEAQVSGVISFYNYFTTKPKGKYCVDICLGTACYVKGAQDILDKFKLRLMIDVGECTDDGLFSLEACRCIGACGLAPVMMVNEDVHPRMTP